MTTKIRILNKWWRYFISIFVCLNLMLFIYQKKEVRVSPRSIFKFIRNVNNSRIQFSQNKTKNDAIIIFWTSWFNSRDVKLLKSQTTFSKCEVKCKVTFDRSFFNQSTGIIFHASDIKRYDIPPYLDHQAWIFTYLEAPVQNINLHPFQNLSFNWTMTYRQDSDFYHPYGRLIPRNKQIDSFNFTTKDLKKSLQGRKLVAWLVSHCRTEGQREVYIKELSKFIPVDVYGNCGKLKCSGENSSYENCMKFLASSYKFYLSFENALCHDYITEKFFGPLCENIVPVVYGMGNYELHAPNGSYINTREFKSPKELSKYLLYLDSHDEEYLKYFEWKKELKSVLYPMDQKSPWCLLCKKLVQFKESLKNGKNEFPRQSYDIDKWWFHKPNSTVKPCM